jgi:hypothetical protein
MNNIKTKMFPNGTIMQLLYKDNFVFVSFEPTIIQDTG